MSQAKVDRYKAEKANRKKIMKKQKTIRAISTACATVVCVVVLGWIGYSAYGYFHTEETKTVARTEVNMDALNDYLNTLPTAE